MFTYILFFMLALFIFHAGPAPQVPPASWWLYFWGNLTALVLFGYEIRNRFGRLQRLVLNTFPESFGLQHRFQQAQQRLMILSLLFFGVEVFVLDLKALIQSVPGAARIGSWEGVLGLSWYLIHLLGIWYFGFPLYRRLFRSTLTRWGYVRSQFQFNLPILFPWLLMTVASDVLEQAAGTRFREILNHPLGELAYLLVFLFLLSVFLPYLIKVWWQCRPVPEDDKKEALLEFCRKAGSPFREMLLWPVFEGQLLTAAVMGLVRRFRYLLITPALLRLLNPEELQGVVAHEIGHIRKRHMLFYLLFFGGYALLALLFFQFVGRNLLTRPEVLKFLSRWPDYAESLIAVLTLIPLAFFLILYFRFLFGFFMRNFERQADLYALELVGSPGPLIGSLEKIALYSGQDRRLPSWHHFSIAERVEFLEQSSREPRLIARHRRKVRSSVAVYLVLLAALGLYGWRSPDLFLARGTSEARILEQMLQKELRAHPDDPRILAGLGLVYQQQDKHREAEAAYQKVLKLEPRNALVINNLAWMYATSRDPQFHKPREALALAQEAAMLKPDPVVLDTLAEAYLVNDRPDLALRTADKILERDPDNRDYFERQRERFQKALEKQESEKGLPKVAI